jgi:hypothetical protein
MQKELPDLSDSDRRTYRRWTLAVSVIYGVVCLLFGGLIWFHPPVLPEAVAKVEGVETVEATGSIEVAHKMRLGKQRHGQR